MRQRETMIITCQRCNTKFALNGHRIKTSGSKVRCSKCSYVFTCFKNNFGNTFKKEKGAAKIISLSNQKGGVSKTTTCLNLGVSLARLDKRVLLVDLDVQANLTILLGAHNNRSFYDVLESGAMDISAAVVRTNFARLYLLPSNNQMVLMDKKYFGLENFEYMLKGCLQKVNNQFDYILIDTPPSIGYYGLNALTAADMIIIPCQCEYLSTLGVGQTIKFINLVKAKTNPEVNWKILITMYNKGDTVSQLMVSKMKKTYKKYMLSTIIEMDTKIKEAQVMRLPVGYYDRESVAAKAYLQMAQEIVQAMN
jgi:chromosome partitioning protein